MRKPIRKRIKKAKRENLDVDITSLLDILVILLVFLLHSYNSSGIVIDVPSGISLPRSDSQSPSTTGVMIQVSPAKIWVDSEEVLSTDALPERVYDYGGRRIIPLYNKLVAIKNKIKEVEKASPDAKKFSGLANLIVDKSLKYTYLKKIMFTCAEAGFKTYKFVVLADE
jgi:biopolymer transport protein ExbD